MWSNDIAQAQLLENKLAIILSKLPTVQTVTTSSSIHGKDVSFTEWDIKVVLNDGEESTLELKQDKLAASTKNVAIEYCRIIGGNKRDTGISTTTALVWVQHFSNTFYAIEVQQLRKMIINKEYSRIQKGGDSGRAFFYLFPISKFKKHCVEISE